MLSARPFALVSLKNRSFSDRSFLLLAGAGLCLAVGIALGRWLPVHLLGFVLLGLAGFVLPLLLCGRRHSKSSAGPTRRAAVAAPPAKPTMPAHAQSQEIRCNPFFELLSSSSL